MEKPRDTGKQKVRSAEVGTDILKALAELSPATSLSRLAEHVQMPASKVHRYLQALIASGFAEQNSATNHYGLGREALRVGLAALGSMDVLKVGAMPLAQLRDELNETCFLAVWGNQGATVVQIESAVRAVVHQIRMSGERELPSRRIGEFVMAELRKLDHVGYVRFASVYRSFEDVADFREEIERLERDLPPGEGQLPLLQGGGVVSLERHADRLAERQKKR